MAEILNCEKVMNIGMRGYKEFRDVNWHGQIIKIRYLLSRSEEWDLIHSILKCATGAFDGNNYVIPEMLDLATRANIVVTYTGIELPTSIDDQHTLLYASDLFDVITANINRAQYMSILNSIKLYTLSGDAT